MDTSPDTSQASTPADGDFTRNGMPLGFTALTPFLAVPRAADALTFYCDVFGARLASSTEMGGVVVHAELDFGSGRLQLGEPNPAFHLVAQPDGDDACVSMGLYCPDVDGVVAKAVAAGAVVREPATAFASGDRFASIRDPFGIRWSVMTRVEDLSEEESAARVAAWAAEQSAG